MSTSSEPHSRQRLRKTPSSPQERQALLTIRPIAMPPTGLLMLTPASIRASVEPQVLAIDEEPLLSRISLTSLMV